MGIARHTRIRFSSSPLEENVAGDEPVGEIVTAALYLKRI